MSNAPSTAKYTTIHTLVVDGPKGTDGKPGKPVEIAAGRPFESSNTTLVESLLAQGAIRETNPKRKVKVARDDDGNPLSPSGYAPGTASPNTVVSDPNAPDADAKKEDLSSITAGAASDDKAGTASDDKAGTKK